MSSFWNIAQNSGWKVEKNKAKFQGISWQEKKSFWKWEFMEVRGIWAWLLAQKCKLFREEEEKKSWSSKNRGKITFTRPWKSWQNWWFQRSAAAAKPHGICPINNVIIDSFWQFVRYFSTIVPTVRREKCWIVDTCEVEVLANYFQSTVVNSCEVKAFIRSRQFAWPASIKSDRISTFFSWVENGTKLYEPQKVIRSSSLTMCRDLQKKENESKKSAWKKRVLMTPFLQNLSLKIL